MSVLTAYFLYITKRNLRPLNSEQDEKGSDAETKKRLQKAILRIIEKTDQNSEADVIEYRKTQLSSNSICKKN